MGFAPYPTGQADQPDSHTPAPASIRKAVWLMYAGATLSAVGLLVALTSPSAVPKSLLSTHPTMGPATGHTEVKTIIGGTVVSALLGIALWLWLAAMIRRGRGWARTTGTLLFTIFTLSLLISLIHHASPANLTISLATWLVALAAVRYLWRRESSDFLATAAAPGPPGVRR